MTGLIEELYQKIPQGLEVTPLFTQRCSKKNLQDLLVAEKIDLLVAPVWLASLFEKGSPYPGLQQLVYQIKLPVVILPENCLCQALSNVVLLTNFQLRHSGLATSCIRKLVSTCQAELNLLYIAKRNIKLTPEQEQNKELLQAVLDDVPCDLHYLTAEKPLGRLKTFLEHHQSDMLIFFAKNINLSEHYLFDPLTQGIHGSEWNIPLLLVHE